MDTRITIWQRLSKSYPPQFELIPLFLLVLNVYQTLTTYPSLPGTVPGHFNLMGFPDRWEGKSSLLVNLVLGVALYAFFTVINILLATVKDPRKLLNLPEKRKAALSSAQMEDLRSTINRCLFAIKVFMQAMLLYISYVTMEIALRRVDRMGLPFFLLLGGVMLVAGYMVWKSLRIAPSPPSLPGIGRK